VDAVGIEDNFFDVGGNSFSLARVHARIVELLGQQLSLVALYEHPTISALADHLTRPAVPATPPAEPTRAHDRLLAGRARLARRRSQHV
jgi:hypothetical protein